MRVIPGAGGAVFGLAFAGLATWGTAGCVEPAVRQPSYGYTVAPRVELTGEPSRLDGVYVFQGRDRRTTGGDVYWPWEPLRLERGGLVITREGDEGKVLLRHLSRSDGAPTEGADGCGPNDCWAAECWAELASGNRWVECRVRRLPEGHLLVLHPRGNLYLERQPPR